MPKQWFGVGHVRILRRWVREGLSCSGPQLNAVDVTTNACLRRNELSSTLHPTLGLTLPNLRLGGLGI